jgi:hypothetical protein
MNHSMKECLSARKVRQFSDTGAWKQTALRVALFGPVTSEYPLTAFSSSQKMGGIRSQDFLTNCER